MAIGKAKTERFLDQGAFLTLVGRTKSKLEDFAKPCPADKVLIVEADVAEENEGNELVAKTTEKLGRLDILFLTS